MEINEPRKPFNWLLFAGVLVSLVVIVFILVEGC